MRKFFDSILAQLVEVQNWSDETLKRYKPMLKAIDEAVCDLIELKEDDEDPDETYTVEEDWAGDAVATDGVNYVGGSSHNVPAELSHRIGLYSGRTDFIALEQAVECLVATCREDDDSYKMLRAEIEG